MITLRRSEGRRHVRNESQNTLLSFDPESESDPFRWGFRTLEALNEETPVPEMGLHPHGEEDLEIVTYVREGVLARHEAGGPGHVQAGEFQRTSAGGSILLRVIHGSVLSPAHVFQSFITPNGIKCEAGIEKKRFPVADRKGVLRLVASSDGRDGSLCIQQDVQMYSSILLVGHHLVHALTAGRAGWLHVVKGRVALQDHFLGTGDAAGLEGETSVSFTAQVPSEILLFNLA